MTMRYTSVCSGIEAASCAWQLLGWRAVAFSEIEPFACAVLAHHYPTTPNWGDMTRFNEWPDATIDVLCGGTPCQSFSLAGLRKGLDDPRGNLMLVYLAIAARYRPRWLVWENVPGVLSSSGGRDFGAFLRGLAELRYGFAYRVLDAQYWGVAQRRRRVFVVGCAGDWQRAAAVLFERASLSGHPAPGREARQDVAGTLTARTRSGGGLGTDFEIAGGLIASTGDVSHCLNARGMGRQDYESETLTAHTTDAPAGAPLAFDCKAGGNTSFSVGALPGALRGEGHGGGHAAVAYKAQSVSIRGRDGGATAELSGDVATALRASQGGGDKPHVLTDYAVRRLLPVECERLQGFPDGYTAITVRGKPAADGPRYKAIGNSWAVPVARWIGQRIAQVESICNWEEAKS